MSCILKAAVGVHKDSIKKEISEIIDRIMVERGSLYKECCTNLSATISQIYQEAIFDIEKSFIEAITEQNSAMWSQ